ncbi:MAG: hypothetical protein M0R17_11490 [Candidatus Omnitrophica bacterium]|jgi:DNA repair exonuclease SbcCD ATPase subunit|nr:hypothetical protein [Candidatus Omnitrophota bacterium]
MVLKELRNKLEQQKGKQIELKNSINDLRSEIHKNNDHLENLEQALEIIKIVGTNTQKALQFHVSDITSLALESIFPDPYKLVLDFVDRRNKIECDILFERNGERSKPKDSTGGGIIDVTAFALRIACWSMAVRKTRNIIIMDEPMKWVSAEYQESASEMIKEVSKKLGIQFILITHCEALTSYADKVFVVTQNKGISKVIEK